MPLTQTIYGTSTNRKKISFQLQFLFPLIIVFNLLSGCSPVLLKQQYLSPDAGLMLEKPKSWEADFFERSGLLVLEAKTRIWKKESTRIEIYGSSCNPKYSNPNNVADQFEVVNSEINRIKQLYYLESITIIKKPEEVGTGENEIIKAVISVPTIAMQDNPSRIQIGDPTFDTFQIIEVYSIADNNSNSVLAYIYKGLSDELNKQAEGIVYSIKLTCPLKN